MMQQVLAQHLIARHDYPEAFIAQASRLYWLLWHADVHMSRLRMAWWRVNMAVFNLWQIPRRQVRH
jgi:hypothetical protein